MIVDKSFNDGASNAREGDGEDDGDGNSQCGFGGNFPRCRQRRKELVRKRRTRAATAMKAAATAMAIAMASENLAEKIFSSYFFGSLAFQTLKGIMVPTSETVGIIVLCSIKKAHNARLGKKNSP